jgi:CHASE3 domain sensor protein
MEENNKEEKNMEGNKFMNKWGFLVLIGGVIVIFTILKLIGFPEILFKP